MIKVLNKDTTLLLSSIKDMLLRIWDIKHDFHTRWREFIINESKFFQCEQGKFIPACGNVHISLRSWSLQFIQIIFKNSVPLHRNYTTLPLKIPHRLFYLGKKTIVYCAKRMKPAHENYGQNAGFFNIEIGCIYRILLFPAWPTSAGHMLCQLWIIDLVSGRFNSRWR
jgi:hypothetical protein